MKSRSSFATQLFAFSLFAGFIIALACGWLIYTPVQIANHFSPVLYVPFVVFGALKGKSLGDKFLFGLVGVLGSFLGWMIFRLLILH